MAREWARVNLLIFFYEGEFSNKLKINLNNFLKRLVS